MRWSVLLLGGALAAGCSTTMTLESQQRPENAKLKMWAECLHDGEAYWTDVRIENTSDASVELNTDCFRMRDAQDRPMTFADWAWFGGHRHTTGRPRPIHAKRHTFGRVRWKPAGFTPTVRLEVEVAGETHAFVFKEP